MSNEIPMVSIAFKPDELVELIRILRNEADAAFVMRHYDRAGLIGKILLKLGYDKAIYER